MKMKPLDSSEIVGLIGKAADAFLKSLALLAACPHHRLWWVEPCWSIWWCFIFSCACIFWIQISLPKIIFCIPNIHPPAEMLGLLVDVWSVTAAGQNQHLLPIDSEADFDPFQALCAQSGRAQHEGSMLERGTEPTPEHWRVGPEVPSTQRICHL